MFLSLLHTHYKAKAPNFFGFFRTIIKKRQEQSLTLTPTLLLEGEGEESHAPRRRIEGEELTHSCAISASMATILGRDGLARLFAQGHHSAAQAAVAFEGGDGRVCRQECIRDFEVSAIEVRQTTGCFQR